jgi:hypothetical protein
MGMSRRTRRWAVAMLTGVAALGYVAGSATGVEAAAPGLEVFKTVAPLPKFPCSNCVTSISGTATGAIHGASNFTAVQGAVTGSANYFETGCPPLSGTANGTLSMAMKDGSVPATATFSFHYQRTGLVAVITGSGSVADNSGAHKTSFAGTALGLFTATLAKNQLVPPCSSSPATVTVTGVLVTH